MKNNEKLYQATMNVFKRMLQSDLINEEEYRKIEELMLEKYKPVLGALFSDISLT